ncbi:hypothetical protein ACJJTC_013373 [Scirpophaga incertulas]
MEGKETIKELLKKRSIIKGRLTKFKEYINMLNQVGSSKITSIQVRDISMRIDKFQDLLSEFNTLQTDIEMHSTNMDEQLAERDIIEAQFFSLLSMAHEIVNLSTPSTGNVGTGQLRPLDLKSTNIPLLTPCFVVFGRFGDID